MSGIVLTHAPNPTAGGQVQDSNSTAWQVIGCKANDRTAGVRGYSSIAALLAAGDVCWPGIEGAGWLQEGLIRSCLTSGGDGDGFFYAESRTDAAPPTNATADSLVSGGGQQETRLQVKNVWYRKVTGTDVIQIGGKY